MGVHIIHNSHAVHATDGFLKYLLYTAMQSVIFLTRSLTSIIIPRYFNRQAPSRHWRCRLIISILCNCLKNKIIIIIVKHKGQKNRVKTLFLYGIFISHQNFNHNDSRWRREPKKGFEQVYVCH